jgi:hypothetical protein
MRHEIQNPKMFETDPALHAESFSPAIYFRVWLSWADLYLQLYRSADQEYNQSLLAQGLHREENVLKSYM